MYLGQFNLLAPAAVVLTEVGKMTESLGNSFQTDAIERHLTPLCESAVDDLNINSTHE